MNNTNNTYVKIVSDISEKAKKSNPIQQGDYIGKDGLIYCGKCNTAKQSKITIANNVYIVHCICECRSKEIEQEKEKEKEVEEKNKISERISVAFGMRRQFMREAYTFENDKKYDPNASLFSYKYAQTFDRNSKGILFLGGCGTGKTFLAGCICNAVIDRGFTVKFTTVSEIEAALWDCVIDKQYVYNHLDSFDLLVLDDLGAERNTEYEQEIAYNIVNMRCAARKPLIVTTNLPPQEINNPKELSRQRIFSRIYEICIPIIMDGEDLRKKEMLRTAQEEKEKILKGNK